MSTRMADAPTTILRGWAKAYRDSPEHRFPSDPDAEFFPVDMECAADRIEKLERTLLAAREYVASASLAAGTPAYIRCCELLIKIDGALAINSQERK